MIKPDKTSFSPHSNPFRPAGTGVVIHATRSGKPGFAMELAATLNHFANPDSEVSAHWVIGRQGEKVRVIADTAQSWHAGEHNATHFGIELEQGVESDGFTDAQIGALVEVCRGYVEDFGIAPVHSPSTLMSGFIGHQETVQGKRAGKTDPGKLFPWDRFIALLNPPAMVAPTPRDVAFAGGAAATFMALGKPLSEMHEFDKGTLRWIAQQV